MRGNDRRDDEGKCGEEAGEHGGDAEEDEGRQGEVARDCEEGEGEVQEA